MRRSSTQAASQSLAREPQSSRSRFPPASFRSQQAPSRYLPSPSKSQRVQSRSQHRVAQYPPSLFISIPPRPTSHHQPVLLRAVLPVVLPQQLRPANHSLVRPTRRILHQVPVLLPCLVLSPSCYRGTCSWSLADLAFHTGVLIYFYPLTIINTQWPLDTRAAHSLGWIMISSQRCRRFCPSHDYFNRGGRDRWFVANPLALLRHCNTFLFIDSQNTLINNPRSSEDMSKVEFSFFFTCLFQYPHFLCVQVV